MSKTKGFLIVLLACRPNVTAQLEKVSGFVEASAGWSLYCGPVFHGMDWNGQITGARPQFHLSWPEIFDFSVLLDPHGSLCLTSVSQSVS